MAKRLWDTGQVTAGTTNPSRLRATGSELVDAVIVRALAANTVTLFIKSGDGSDVVGSGYEMSPGDALTLTSQEVDEQTGEPKKLNLAEVYIQVSDSTTTGQKVALLKIFEMPTEEVVQVLQQSR